MKTSTPCRSSDVLAYHFVAQIKTMDYVCDVIKWLKSVGCQAKQYKSTWVILCVIPKDKISLVMSAYDSMFGWKGEGK